MKEYDEQKIFMYRNCGLQAGPRYFLFMQFLQ